MIAFVSLGVKQGFAGPVLVQSGLKSLGMLLYLYVSGRAWQLEVYENGIGPIGIFPVDQLRVPWKDVDSYSVRAGNPTAIMLGVKLFNQIGKGQDGSIRVYLSGAESVALRKILDSKQISKPDDPRILLERKEFFTFSPLGGIGLIFIIVMFMIVIGTII